MASSQDYFYGIEVSTNEERAVTARSDLVEKNNLLEAIPASVLRIQFVLH